MKQLEVRCCCQPQKVLGHISVPEDLIGYGRYLSVSIVVAPDFSVMAEPCTRIAPIRSEVIKFPIDWINTGPGSRHLAVKAEGREVDELIYLLEPWKFVPVNL